MASSEPWFDEILLTAVVRLKRGEALESSSRQVVERLRPALLKYFGHHHFSTADAEDLAQETLSKALVAIASLRDESCFLGWLYQIARNVRLRAQSSVHRRAEGLDAEVESLAELPDGDPSPLQSAIETERLERTWQAIETLPPQQKQCLLLQVVREMSYEEIGAVMRLNVRTVRNHLREARLKLRMHLEEG